jgi:hypothetical protein
MDRTLIIRHRMRAVFVADYMRASCVGEPPARHLEPDRKSIAVKATA